MLIAGAPTNSIVLHMMLYKFYFIYLLTYGQLVAVDSRKQTECSTPKNQPINQSREEDQRRHGAAHITGMYHICDRKQLNKSIGLMLSSDCSEL